MNFHFDYPHTSLRHRYRCRSQSCCNMVLNNWTWCGEGTKIWLSIFSSGFTYIPGVACFLTLIISLYCCRRGWGGSWIQLHGDPFTTWFLTITKNALGTPPRDGSSRTKIFLLLFLWSPPISNPTTFFQLTPFSNNKAAKLYLKRINAFHILREFLNSRMVLEIFKT